MKCKVEKSNISGQIVCPPNKSYTLTEQYFLHHLQEMIARWKMCYCQQILLQQLKHARKFGAEIETENSSIIVKNPIKFGKIVPEINTENSGTTIRIASGIASLFSDEITLTGDESLQKRPMQPLLDALSSIGAQCQSTDGKPPIKIKGKISGGDVTIPGNFSSQFISALLISAPLTENGINLSIKENLVSKPYLDATIATMRKFGVLYKH